MAMDPIPVSVLDVVPVWRGTTATDALRRTVKLATEVERLGYHRYWVAEHHNTPALATSAPAVLAAQLAAATSTIRVGSGGVMLPNHPPLIVAEQFGVLSALHPDRIDLGIGRAPGTDPVTARALRRAEPPHIADFANQLAELAGYFATAGRPAGPIDAGAAGEHGIPIWLLGSSPSSALLAARLGLRYAFSHLINPDASAAALTTYREHFQPSADLTQPYSLVCALVVAAESDAAADRTARPYLLGKLRMRTTPRFDAFPTQQDADAYQFTPDERKLLREFADQQIVGGPATVQRKVSELAARTTADELMALTIVPEYGDLVASHRIVAEVMGLGHSRTVVAEVAAAP